MSKIGVSQKAIIYNKEGGILILHRTSEAPSCPNYWDLPGGELDFGEDATSGIIREIQEEAGIICRNIKPFDVESHIDESEEFWVTIAYKCQYEAEDVKLSFEHDEFKWISKDNLSNYKFSNKIKRFVQNYDTE
ncbi:MAG: NUDIX hydrolase [Candidatus Pacebacteria bacterium]|nr:NUDIX hydrolase [Candidatus Paceibacterota bacterium]